jgi:hypothetical protein
MLNSFNVITEKVSVDDVIRSGIGVFAHIPDEEPSIEVIDFMIFYFKEMEMYDKCAALKKYIECNYNEDGKPKEERCKCEYPDIIEYVPKIKCAVCNLRIKR